MSEVADLLRGSNRPLSLAHSGCTGATGGCERAAGVDGGRLEQDGLSLSGCCMVVGRSGRNALIPIWHGYDRRDR